MKADDISDVALIGAGTMGAGFGLCFALAGCRARLYDINPKQLGAGLARIENALKLFVSEGVVTSQEAAAVLPRISTSTSLPETLNGVQFVLEAVPEKIELKQDLFPKMEALVGPRTILASNTSALSISAIAGVCQRPELICGMHWFNPPELVPLVEVIKGQKTSEETVNLVYDLVKRLDHEPIIVQKEIPGFVGNRMQMALFREALNIMAEGVAGPEDVDKALKYALGFRWSWQGPAETADLGGLDIWNAVSTYLFPRISNMTETPEFFKKMIEAGKLGIKNGRGFYDYDEKAGLEAVRKRDLYFIRQRKMAQRVRES